MSKPFAVGDFPGAADLNDLTGVYDRSTSEVDVVSSVTETTIYSKAIAAGALSVDRAVRLRVVGDYLNDTGGTILATVGVKFDGTVVFARTFTVPTSTARRAFAIEAVVQNLSAVSQFAQCTVRTGANVTDNASGESKSSHHGVGAAAIDTAAAVTLAVTVQLGTSSASASWRKKAAILELL